MVAHPTNFFTEKNENYKLLKMIPETFLAISCMIVSVVFEFEQRFFIIITHGALFLQGKKSGPDTGFVFLFFYRSALTVSVKNVKP